MVFALLIFFILFIMSSIGIFSNSVYYIKFISYKNKKAKTMKMRVTTKTRVAIKYRVKNILLLIFKGIIKGIIKITFDSPVRIFLASFVFIVLILFDFNNSLFPERFIKYFTWFFLVYATYTLIDFITSTIRDSNSYIRYDIVSVLLLLSLVALSGVSITAMISNSADDNFYVILIMLFIVTIPLIRFIFVCFSLKNKSSTIVLSIVAAFLIIESYIFLISGIYNISFIEEQYIYSLNNLKGSMLMLKILHHGATYIFDFPNYKLGLEFFIQYIIGFSLNVVFLGILISFLTDIIRSPKSFDITKKLKDFFKLDEFREYKNSMRKFYNL